jgi:hypothetical protein
VPWGGLEWVPGGLFCQFTVWHTVLGLGGMLLNNHFEIASGSRFCHAQSGCIGSTCIAEGEKSTRADYGVHQQGVTAAGWVDCGGAWLLQGIAMTGIAGM